MNMIKSCVKFALVFSLFCLVFNDLAAYASVATVRASQVRDFHRLTFEWPRPTYVTADVSGDQLTIQFERPLEANLNAAVKQMPSVVSSYSLSSDKKTLVLKLSGHYRARAFVSDQLSGVDILPIASKPTNTKVIALAESKQKQQSQSQNTEIKKVIPIKIAPKPLTNTNKHELLTKLSPAAGEEPAPIQTLAERLESKRKKQASGNETQAEPEQVDEAAPKAKVMILVQNNATETAKSKETEVTAAPAAGITETLTIETATEPVETIVELPQDKPTPIAETSEPVQQSPTLEQEVVAAPIPKPASEAASGPVDVAQPVGEQEPEVVSVSKPELENESQQASVNTEKTEETEQTQNAEVIAESETVPEVEAATEESVEAQNEQVVKEEEKALEDAINDRETEMVGQELTEPENAVKKMEIRARQTGEELRIHFPWQERTAAAAYMRNNTVWVVFNHFASLDLDQVNTMLRSGANIKQLPVENATIVYIPVNPGTGVEMHNIDGTFRWEIIISPGQYFAEDPVKPQIHTEAPLKPHVLLPFLDVAEVVQFKDPIIGDVIDILPVYTVGKGVTPARSFLEFDILDTVQGLAVIKKSNEAEVDVVRNGVKITTQDGAIISPGLPLPEEVANDQVESKLGVLFPYEEWKVEEDVHHTDQIELIKKKIARTLASNEAEYYKRLAEIHLAYGEAVEALGYLQNIKRMDPDFYVAKKLSAMQGAANFLLHRYADAARNFRVAELRDLDEVKFWDVMLAELLGKPAQYFDYEENYEPYIQHYPPIMMQRIGIFAADRYIASKDYNAALKIFDQLNEHKLLNEVADYINYLMGKVALETQKPADGYKLWEDIINGPATEFVKVRAEFSLIVEKMRNKEIELNDAVERLERLAVRWRGDNLELAVLKILSDIYEANKSWAQAIRVWRSMNEAFPNTVEAVDASRKMDDAFIAIFDHGEKGNLTDLDLLFLYNEYRELIPEDETGDRIVDKISDLMIDMDMLGPAAKLLEDRMRYRFEHVDRSEVGAKLARVLLLDNKPEEALQALQLSMFGLLPDELLTRRTYLNAEALLQMNRYEDLFLLLRDDESSKADYYRMQAYWQSKNWQKLAESGEQVLKNRSNPMAPLSSMERDVLIKLAMAYVALEENEQIAYLRDYFTPLMKNQPKADVFKFLTQPYLKLTTENFDQVMKMLDRSQTFLANDYTMAPQPSEENSEEQAAAANQEG